MRPCVKRGVTGEAVAELKPTEGASRRLAGAALAAAALMLAACTASAPPVETPASLPPPAIKPAEAEISPAALREHQRILAAYGGVYNDPRLQGMLEQTVDRLVAASERPDLHYRVTMLNSQSINAFALPTGQLYVTRGLIALANDNSELASVLAHEMAHVIARHAAIREDQARQAALVNRVVTDVISDPEAGRARARQIEDRAGRLLARAGIRGRRHRRRHLRARRLRPLRRRALPHLDGQQSQLQAAARRQHRSARAGLPVVASGDAGAHQQRPRQRAAVHRPAASGRRTRQGRVSRRHRRDRVMARTRAKASCAAAASCIRKLGFTFTAPDGFSLDNTAQAVFGVKDGGAPGAAPRRRARAGRTEARRVSQRPAGSRTSIPAASRRSPSTAFPARRRPPRAISGTFRLYAVRFGSDVYRFIFAAKNRSPEARQAPSANSLGTFRRMSLAEIADAKPLRLQVVRSSPATRSRSWPPGWRSPTGPWNASACSTGSSRGTG